MALTITEIGSGVPTHLTGGGREAVFEITGDTSYPAAGYPVTAANFGMTTIASISPDVSLAGRVWDYEPTTSKIRVLFCGAVNAVMKDNTVADISADIVRVRVIGT